MILYTIKENVKCVTTHSVELSEPIIRKIEHYVIQELLGFVKPGTIP